MTTTLPGVVRLYGLEPRHVGFEHLTGVQPDEEFIDLIENSKIFPDEGTYL